MRAIVSRVHRAKVTTPDGYEATIRKGFVVYLGVAPADTEAQARLLADRIAGMRVFEDDAGKMNLSPHDVNAELLVISNFTLYGDAFAKRRPSFTSAAPASQAEALYEHFLTFCRDSGLPVRCGRFGAHMDVTAVGDGPVNLILDTEPVKP